MRLFQEFRKNNKKKNKCLLLPLRNQDYERGSFTGLKPYKFSPENGYHRDFQFRGNWKVQTSIQILLMCIRHTCLSFFILVCVGGVGEESEDSL